MKALSRSKNYFKLLTNIYLTSILLVMLKILIEIIKLKQNLLINHLTEK